MASRNESRVLCVSIDVERDYRLDGSISVRGVQEGLPPFVDLLRSRSVPFDLFISGEIAEYLPRGLTDGGVAIGCHAMRHPAGPRSYLNRMTTDRQRREISEATARVQATVGRSPIHFRAPNFSVDGRTISILEDSGYRVDSSVLPGRYVKRWRMFPLLDHRDAPAGPYHPDSGCLVREGASRILEVPVTPNMILRGGPLGLGFLNAAGPGAAIQAALAAPSRYVILLAHTWEMVDWGPKDPVAPWVRTAGSSHLEAMASFLDGFSDSSFFNMDQILESGPEHPRGG